MSKLLTFVLPMLMNRSGKGPIKSLIGRSIVNFLVALGFLFLMSGIFVWVTKHYNSELAFLTLASLMFASALVLVLRHRHNHPAEVPTQLPEEIKDDFLAPYIPEALAKDPIVQKFLREIAENPMAASATAVALGMLISRELLDGD